MRPTVSSATGLRLAPVLALLLGRALAIMLHLVGIRQQGDDAVATLILEDVAGPQHASLITNESCDDLDNWKVIGRFMLCGQDEYVIEDPVPGRYYAFRVRFDDTHYYSSPRYYSTAGKWHDERDENFREPAAMDSNGAAGLLGPAVVACAILSFVLY